MFRQTPINAAPEKFHTQGAVTLIGLLLVASWSARLRLVRTDERREVSARWGFEQTSTVVWCFPD